MIRIIGVSALALPFCLSSSFAQAPKPSPELEAIGAKLMQEINAGIQCSANAIVGRAKIEELEKELEKVKKELADARKD